MEPPVPPAVPECVAKRDVDPWSTMTFRERRSHARSKMIGYSNVWDAVAFWGQMYDYAGAQRDWDAARAAEEAAAAAAAAAEAEAAAAEAAAAEAAAAEAAAAEAEAAAAEAAPEKAT